jgi:hypothetical protein
MFRLFILVLVGVLAVAPGAAQFDQGQIAGTISDTSGAVVVGATVTSVNLHTGVRRSAVTGQNGTFVFTNMPVGYYDVTVEAESFRRFVTTNVKVDAATRTTVDASLELGAVTETVNVTASVAQLQQETAQVGRVVEARQISDLALSGRNPMRLALLRA